MVKKCIALLAMITLSFGVCACGSRTVTCDRCGAEVKVSEKSNVTDEWTIYCNDCEKELGLDQLPEKILSN